MNNKITFSQTVKNEIASEEDFSLERRKALLSAYLRINGVLVFKNKDTFLKLRSDNSKVARYIYASLKNRYVDRNIHLRFDKKPNKKTTYFIDIGEDTDYILSDLEVDLKARYLKISLIMMRQLRDISLALSSLVGQLIHQKPQIIIWRYQ